MPEDEIVDYERIDHEIVYDICSKHIPALRDEIERMRHLPGLSECQSTE